MMKNYLIIVLCIFLAPKFLLAQTYSGILIDVDSEIPLANANVFLAGTLTGTTTNKDGYFELNTNGNISVPIVFSFVGYTTRVLSWYELSSDSIVRLKKEVLEIEEINVKSNPGGWSRSRMMQVFKEEFLGTSENAQSCKIENGNDIYLYYNIDTKVLHANSRKPIVIENKLLGYRVYYLLDYFRKSDSTIRFKGYCRFEELNFVKDRRKNNIEQQRGKTYLGSIMHFIRYLHNENLNKNDTVYDLEVINRMYSYYANSRGLLIEWNNGHLDRTTLYSKNEINNIYLNKYEDKFQIYDEENNYLSCKNLIVESEGRRIISFDKNIKIVYLGNLKHTCMIPKSGAVEISENGYYNPEQISWSGTMSKQRVGDLLPFEYKYDASVLKKQH
jgi:hypothetical protein